MKSILIVLCLPLVNAFIPTPNVSSSRIPKTVERTKIISSQRTSSSSSLFAVRKPKSVRQKENRRRSKTNSKNRGSINNNIERRENGGYQKNIKRYDSEGEDDDYGDDMSHSSSSYFGDDDDPFGDYVDDGGYDSSTDNGYNYNNDEDDDDYDFYNDNSHQSSMTTTPKKQSPQSTTTTATTTSKHFFSKKSITDPNFSIVNSSAFQQLCNGASISQPSRIQALAWPTLLQGQNCIVADQTGSGKTLSYLIPLLQRTLCNDEHDKRKSSRNMNNSDGNTGFTTMKRGNGSPRVLILAPTAELADQIKIVCDKTTSNLDVPVWTRVITATGSHSTNIRDQIRMLASQKVDVLISTPGRVATILRTKNTSLDLSHLQSIVLDEVDVLLIDDTFGPQLRTIGAAAPVASAQFVFVTATLPDEIIDSVKREFQNVEVIQGPGLHRIAPNLKEHLVDVSVPSSSNQDLDLCFEYKAKELMKAIRANRCKRTLVFCNTVEACRKVENLVRRNDRRGSLWCVGAYHNAMNPESRRKNLNVFVKGLREKNDVDHVLVCTDRAARGVDFDSAPVDHVVIFDFPKDPAEYVRRVGRTARAGRVGSSTVFAYAWQLPIARKIMGSKLDSFTVASDNFDNEDEEFTQKQRRQARRASGEKDKMIRGNIKSGDLWK